MQSGDRPQEQPRQQVGQDHGDQEARYTQMESRNKGHIEQEQGQRGEYAVYGKQSHQPSCPHKLGGDLSESGSDTVDHQQHHVALCIRQQGECRRKQQQNADAEQLCHTGGSKNLAVVEIFVNAIANDCIGNGKGNDRNQKVCGLFQQLLRAVVAGVDVSRIKPRKQQEQNLGTE